MSSPGRLVLIGGGENARVLADAARSRPEQWRLVGYLDLKPDSADPERIGAPWLGNDAAVDRLISEAEAQAQRQVKGQAQEQAHEQAHEDLWFVLAVAGTRPDPKRRRLVELYSAAGVRWATVVHARAVVAPSVEIGAGAVIYAGAVVNGGARLGAHTLVGSGAVVEHDVTLGDLVQVGPGAVIGGGATVEPDAFLGLGCRIRDHVQVGRGALIGMGAVLVADAPADAVLVGVPARPQGQAKC